MQGTDDIWIFGYGSLMWSPNFSYEEVQLARLEGYHRDLCILSVVFRGTPDIPGLVMGLNPGGHCVGRAYAVSADKKEETLVYLHEREMINDVYAPTWVDIELEDGRLVNAYTFVSVAGHPQFVGPYSLEQKVALVLQGTGKRGTSLEYLENTCTHLRELSICDETLEAILASARSQKG